jgi:hypothetical protein
MVELVPARLTHVGPLAHNLRAIDRIEAEAMGQSPKNALRIGLRRSLSVFTAVGGGNTPLAMLGVVPLSLMGGSGLVWMVGTDDLYRQGRALLTLGPRVIGHWLETFERLENVVSTRNDRAIRLLVRWGFDVGGEVETHGGVDFIPFSLSRGAIQGKARAA